MDLSLHGMEEESLYLDKQISLPNYDIAMIRNQTKIAPTWVHFGVGNIFRIFIGGLNEQLLNHGKSDKGIICVETFDPEVVGKVYYPYDNLSLNVILHGDGSKEQAIIGNFAEAIDATHFDAESLQRLKEIFIAPSLQMISFTITEKGYALKDANDQFFSNVEEDMMQGPSHISHTMSLLAYLLYQRYENGKGKLALVSMDNVSHNGEKLKDSIMTIAKAWQEKGYVSEDFIAYLNDEETIAFPWTMIDKITPRPSEAVKDFLEDEGFENIPIIITEKNTYIAPFVNAEAPQYLVIEDNFPNGRPPLEEAGVYMCDRETVNACERMKVTVCLNPLHTALAPYGCVLGYSLFSDVMKDPEMQALVHQVGPVEGMAVVKDPGILSPQAFIDECINVRFPNPYIPDTPQRIVVDTSQMLAIRFGETIKEYIARDGDAKALIGIPVAIAGWLRYLLGIDEEGNPYPLSPDPMNDELQAQLQHIEIGDPDTVGDALKPILSNANIFGVNLYDAGIGDFIETIFKEEIQSYGNVRPTLQKYLKKS